MPDRGGTGGEGAAPVDQPGGSAGALGSGGRPAVCGGIAGLVCEDDNQYCRYDVGTCEVSDRAGLCTERPAVCAAR
jgi:hypothetical protein